MYLGCKTNYTQTDGNLTDRLLAIIECGALSLDYHATRDRKLLADGSEDVVSPWVACQLQLWPLRPCSDDGSDHPPRSRPPTLSWRCLSQERQPATHDCAVIIHRARCSRHHSSQLSLTGAPRWSPHRTHSRIDGEPLKTAGGLQVRRPG